VSAESVALLLAGLLALVASATAYLTAHRLDRLHIRTDLARLSLVGALGRRHAVAGAVQRALETRDPGTAAALGRALAGVRAYPPQDVVGQDPQPGPEPGRPAELLEPGNDPDAEHAENALGLALAGVERALLPADLAAELDDVSDRVEMARRFHNDAVRDTRALRERAPVRLLRLAGRAPMPDYVELVDGRLAGGRGSGWDDGDAEA